MKIALLATCCISINIQVSLGGKLSSLKLVDSCPINEQAWKQKSLTYSCSDYMTYHCIFAKNESMYELCMNANDITDKVGCPQINFYEDKILFDSTYSECPTENKDCPKGNETYKTDSLYQFPACLQKLSIRANFRKRNGKFNGNGTQPVKATGKEETNKNVGLIVAVVSLACVCIIFFIALLWIKRKDLGCLQRCQRRTLDSGNSSLVPKPSVSEREEDTELEPFVPKGAEGSDEAESSQPVNESNSGGQKANVKLGALFDWTFRLKSSYKGMKINKDGREVLAGKRVVMSDTKEGYRLIILQLTREDEGEYTCININTKETETVHLRIEKASRAVYHLECKDSLRSIPYILFFLQQAIRQSSNIDETAELRSTLNNIRKETFNVLTLSYENITKIHMLSRKTEAVHLNEISAALRSHRTADIRGKVSRMARDIGEGQKIVENTLEEVKKVMDVINDVEANFTKLPSVGKDMSSCNESLRTLFAKWTEYKQFFSSVKFVITEGRSFTGEEDENALTPNDPEILRIYVASVGCSTQYYAEIYLGLIKELVIKFYANESLQKDNIDRLSQKIKDLYDEMYERDSRAGEQRALQNVKNTNIEEIE